MSDSIGPGIYPDLSNTAYHSDPSLSSSGARMILDSPARFAYERSHPARSDAFDFGSAAHKLVLDDDLARLWVVDADSWRTRAAREEREAAHAVGAIPILAGDYTTVVAMADAIRCHPVAGALLTPGTGVAEESLFWRDPLCEVMLRARPDWITRTAEGRLLIVDYKTTASGAPRDFARSVAAYGYHQQDAWYRDAATACGLDDEPAFVFVVQEKSAPYLVHVFELDPTARRIGAERNRRAIGLWAYCVMTDTWPGSGDEIEMVSLPRWAEIEHEEDYA